MKFSDVEVELSVLEFSESIERVKKGDGAPVCFLQKEITISGEPLT